MITIHSLKQIIESEIADIKIIDIENQDVSMLWPLISRFHNLEEIYLTECKLKTVPKALFELPKLKTAYFRGNKINGIDIKGANPPKLKIINFDDNEFEVFPEGLNDIFWEVLSFSNNKIATLPNIASHFTSLESLDLEKNQIRELPNYFNENVFSYLSYLYLSHNKLEKFPSKLGSDNNLLRSIHIQFNLIKELPLHIDGAKNLISLLASSNQFNQVPECVRQMPELQTLYLANNKITSIPPWLEELTNLNELNIGGNQLDETANIIFKMKSLEILRLHNCGIEKIDEVFFKCSNLLELDLSGNNLSNLPENIGDLQQLESLKIGWNQLTDLPKSILDLQNLKELQLSGNEKLNPTTKQILLKRFKNIVH